MPDHSGGFTLEIQGKNLGTFGTLKGLEAQVDVVEYREGGVNDIVHRLPGAVTYPNIVLSQGLSTGALLEWFMKTLNGTPEPQSMTLTAMSTDNQAICAWSFDHAYPVRWSGPDFSAAGSAEKSAGEQLEIAHYGFHSVPVPPPKPAGA